MSFGILVRQKLSKLVDHLFPPSLFEPGWGFLHAQTVEIAGLPLNETDRGKIARVARKGGSVEVSLPVTAVLRRSHSLPLAAMSKSAGAITVEMRQAFPAKASGLIWKSTLDGIRDGKADYTIYVARSDQTDAIRREVEMLGGRLAGLTIRGGGTLVDYTEKAALRRRWLIGAFVTVLGLFASAYIKISLEARSVRFAADRMSAELAQLEETVIQMKSEQEKQDAFQLGLQSDLVTFNAGRGRARLLRSLNAALPDSIWISELTISRDSIMFAGFTTTDVAAVLRALQSIDLLVAPQLSGPAIVDSLTEETRFQVSAGITSGVPE